MSSLVVGRFEGLEGLQQLSAPWQALTARLRRPHFDQLPAWYEAYFRTVAPAHQTVQFYSVRRGAELVAIAPLMLEPRRCGVRRAKLANDRGIYSADLVIAPEESPGAIWRALESASRRDRRNGWDVFQAGQGGTMQFSCTRSVARELGLRALEKPSRLGYMVIDVGTYEGTMAGLKSKFRNSLKRSQRRLAELGDVRFRWTHEPTDVLVAFERFVELERSGWKGASEPIKPGYPRPAAIGLYKWKYDFYRELLARFASQRAVNLLLVEAGEQLVGAQISLQIGPTNYLLKTTMDESLQGIAVGHVMIDALLKLLAERGDVDQINLLTDYAWHEPWNPRRIAFVDTRIYNRTALGLLAMLRQRARG